MMRTLLAVSLLVLTPARSCAELEIKDIQSALGERGPERHTLEYFPEDEILIRYVVSGVRVDQEGKMDTRGKIRLTTAKGRVVREGDLKRQQGFLALGGGSYPAYVFLSLPPQAPAGEYTVSVTVEDLLASATATFERKVRVKPVEFAIVAQRFYRDAEAKVPAAAGGVLGDLLYVRFRVIGFERGRGGCEVEMNLQVVDKQGKELLPKPLQVAFRNKDPAELKKISHLNFDPNFALNRVGDFTLCISVTDKIAGKTTKFEAPLHVTAP
jgi:hypothetical protein